MGIIRDRLDFETNFTRLPNEWARNKTLSLKARGLLAELISHQTGWASTTESLWSDTDHRAAVQGALKELEDAGFLRRERTKDASGRFSYNYHLADPKTTYTQVAPQTGFPSTVEPSTVETPLRRLDTKKTSLKNNKNIVQTTETEPKPSTDDFDAWWKIYPRKAGKKPATASYRKAIRAIPPERLLSLTETFAQTWVARPPADLKFCPMPATWLNQERWNDELVVDTTEGDKLTQLVEARDVDGIAALTGVKIVYPDFGDVSPREASVLRQRFFDEFIESHGGALRAAASQ